MTAERIARALGGRRCGRGWAVKCPVHGDRHPSLSVADGADGRLLVRCFAGCDARDVLAALRALGLLEGRSDWPDTPPPKPKLPPADEAGRTAAALRLWAESRDPRGTAVERYLAGRGLALEADVAGRVLRYHPALRHPSGGTWPGMLGLFTDLRTDRPTGIHRTFLAPDGSGKAPVDRPKMMLGRAAGSAIKLDGDDWVELGLCIAEGIETGLAAGQLGYRPCWALGSAGAIADLPVLGGVEGLTVLAEADANGVGQRAAEACARRWSAAGVDVEVLEPLDPGDANDVLLRRTAG